MYPSNKKKKVWREEKGNRSVESWGGTGGGGWGGGGGQLCVPRSPPPELPPRALPAGAASLPCPCVHTRARAPRRARAAPRHLRLAHVWALDPLRLPPLSVTFCRGGVGFAPARRGTPARSPGVSHKFLWTPGGTLAPLVRVSHGQVPAVILQPAAAAAPPRPLRPHSCVPRLCPPSGAGSPAFGVCAYSRSPSFPAVMSLLKSGTLGDT